MPGTTSPDVDLTGRTCLVTGANTGIGRATAVGLARRGAHVLLACRSAARTDDVLDEIAALPGDRSGSAAFVPLDLADLDAVRDGAAEVLRRLGPDGRLDLLVNNAGLAGSKGLTEQGFELTFGVSHLGHFLLTNLLLERIVASAPARIVNLTSKAHEGAKGVDFDALQQPTRSPAGLAEYQVAKLCNVLFTQELARRLDADAAGADADADARPRVTTYAVHPGVIRSDIWRRIPWPIRPLMTLFMGSVESGAERVLKCAVDPGMADVSGVYVERGRVTAPNPLATPELAAELWERSETWTK
jgi:NAD(P)-dependent dehydrogenase (short-subunit alcohol dehydrogenase family)